MNNHYDPFKEEKHEPRKEETSHPVEVTSTKELEVEETPNTNKDPFASSDYTSDPVIEPKKHRPLSAYSVAGFWQRLVALTIDFIVASGFSSIFASPVMAMMGKSTGLAVTVVKGFFFLAYFVLSTKITNGQTLGKMILGLRVIHLQEEKLSWTTVIIREGFGRFIQNKFIPIYIITAFTPQKQHLVDMLCDTYVVKEEVYLLEQEAPDLFFQYS